MIRRPPRSTLFPTRRSSDLRAAFQDRLANLCFQRQYLIGVRMQGSEQSRSTWQIAFGLEDSCLVGERVDVVRCDIENLIKLSQRFGETAKLHIGKRVLGE